MRNTELSQHRGTKWGRRPRQGFTLIELLVVIGIIAILTSLLLPAISSARRSTRTLSCLSNMRQLVMAFRFYAHDNKGSLPRRMWSDMPGVTEGYTWPAELWARGYVKNLMLYSCAEMESLRGRADFHAMNSWIIGRAPTASTMGQDFWQQSHYGYNVRNFGSNYRVDPSSGWTGPSAKLSGIRSPATKLLLADSVNPLRYYDERRLFGAYDLLDVFGTTRHAGGLHARHSGGVNVQWADGHATTEKTNKYNPYLTLGDANVSPNTVWPR